MQIRSLSLKLWTPLIRSLIEFFYSWGQLKLRGVWLHGKSGFEFKVRILDLAIELEVQNGFQLCITPPPPPPVKSVLKSWLNGFPLYRSTWKSEKILVKLFSWTVCVFFSCLLCMRVRDNCSLKNSSNLFSYPRFPLPSPFRPLTEKRKKKKKKKKKWNPRTSLTVLNSIFRFRVVRSEKSRFPNRIRLPFYL